MKRLALTACLAVLALPTLAAPIVSGPGACGIRAVDNASFVSCEGDTPVLPTDAPVAARAAPIREIGPREAWRARHNVGARALVIDIRGFSDVLREGAPVGSDANIPYLFVARGQDDLAALRGGHPRFNPRFLDTVDQARADAGLGFGDTLILVCRSGELSRLAAPLLLEHGYTDVRIVAGGFSGVAPESGWKKAGLPWTREVQPGWHRTAR